MKSFLIENEEWLQNYYSAHAEMDKALEANKQLEKRLADYKKEVKRLESKVRRERETFEDLLAEQKTAKERAETTLRRLTDRKSVKIINKFMNAIGRGLY
jgi:predicted  nucleic acid-binding Zn-ribbon protein